MPLAISLLLPNQDQMPPASTSNCPKIKTNHWQIRIKKKKKIVISFGEFEAEGHSRVSAGPEGTGLCSEQAWLLTCVCEHVCAPPEVSVRGPFGTCS